MKRASVPSQAVPLVENDMAKSALFPRLIAYLSLCMLAAAFGAVVGPAWSRWWAIFGAFGLASATGLDVLERSRARSAAQKRKRRLALQAEQKLDKVIGAEESSDAIRAALHRLLAQAAIPARRDSDGQAESRLLLNRPATITRLVRYPGETLEPLGEPLAGRVRDISHFGFGLVHDLRLEEGPVLLKLEPENGEPLQFIADVLWCEPHEGGGYYSGGKFLDVVATPTKL